MIRLGLVSWLLVGAGVLFLGIGLLTAREASRGIRVGLGTTGILVGGWPLVAWLAGPFQPGPFTSALWVPTAIVTAGWFLAAAIALFAWGWRDRASPA